MEIQSHSILHVVPQYAILQYPVIWYPPPSGYLKINTDGDARGRTGESSCGGVFRDYTGCICGAFSEFLGHTTAVEAEICGVIRALNIIWDYGLHCRYKVWLECDSMQVVKLVHSRSLDVPSSIKANWMATLEKLKHMQLHVSHIYREGNSVADKLANYGIDSKCPFSIWFGAPDFVLDEATLDANGIIRLRNKPAKGLTGFYF